MENKLVFCSECGAKLTGSGTFCSHCGAKQDVAPVVTATDFPAKKIVHSTTVPTPPAAITPKISVGGFIMTLLALATTFLAIILYVVAVYRSSRYVNLFRFGDFCLFAWIVPLFAMLMVLTKSKKFAVYGLALALMSLTLQSVMALLPTSFINESEIIRILFLRDLNGEDLFRNIGNFGRGSIMVSLLAVLRDILFWTKNILAAIGCLLVIKSEDKSSC